MPPTGTVTLLFTDVEGSTKLLERLGDGFADAIAEHHRVVREALARHGGYEVDTAGDGFFATFARPGDAVACALEVQAGLADWPARVRMGIHTGTPEWRDGKYVGMDVHRAARVMAAAHGGQVLVTNATAEIVRDGLRDLGEHRLKDLPLPERLWQAGDGDFPPPRSLNLSRLPTPPTALVGREDEVRSAAEALQSGTRLLTLTGPGGSGKTRLGVAVAAEVAPSFTDGAVFVDLAPVADAAGVPAAITTAVAGSGDDVAARLRGRRILLVLDNFEHVTDAAPLLADLLGSEPGLAVLTTSRVPLRLRGEVERRVEPLPAKEAQDLFTARASDAGIEVDPRDPAVVAICRSLDGLPLALELAAARLPLFGATALSERLARRLDVLGSGPRDAPERQRTLRATIEWSHRLLDENAATVFRRLAVFPGGATISAAEFVCGDGALDGIAALLEGSLLRRVPDPDGELRVAMLETLREFAAERLAADDDADAVADRHAAFFVRLAELHAQAMYSDSRTAVDRRMATEIDNVRAAHDHLLESAPEDALRLIGPTWFYWESVGPVSEGRRRLGTSLQRARGDTETRGHALIGAATLAFAAADFDGAEQAIDEVLELLRDGAAPGLQAHAFGRAQTLAELRGDQAARLDYAQQALELARAAGNDRVVALAMNNLADAYMRSDPERAAELLREILELTQDRYAVMFARGNLAELALAAGRHDEASELIDLAMADVQALQIDRSRIWLLATRAGIALASSDVAGARAALADAAVLQASVGTIEFGQELLILAAAVAAQADPLVAARTLGAAGPAPGRQITAYEEDLCDRLRSDLTRVVGEDAFAAAMRAGAATAPEEALRQALAAAKSH